MNKRLSAFSLTLITICSVDSIRNLPAAALAGSQLFTYFTLALFFFLLPCAFIACWFSNQSQQGIYGWVKKGLGLNAGCLAVWYQCIQNILLYPTILSFIAGALIFSFAPELVDNQGLVFLIILALIWGLTWINLKGIHLSSRFNTLCTITGLLVPFIIIMIMGLYWWLTQTQPNDTILPQAEPYSWTSLTAIILSFCGIELTAVYAEDSQAGAFRKAVGLSVFIIFLSMLFGSIVLAMIIPPKQLSFISSIPQLIQLFFTKMHCSNLAVIVNVLIAIGCIGTANNWLIAPVKGLGFAAEEGFLDPRLTELNQHKAPAKLLIIQAICVSVISSLFLIVPSINASYWMMLNAGTQLLLLMYLLLFFSAIKLVLKEPVKKRLTILFPAVLGLFGIMTSLIVSLTPPPSLQMSSKLFYCVSGGLFLMLITLIPVWGQRRMRRPSIIPIQENVK